MDQSSTASATSDEFPLDCLFSSSRLICSQILSGTTEDEFAEQLLQLLRHAPEAQETGIVYVWLTEKEIPRLKNKSRIVYIGRARGSLRERYMNKIRHEIEEFWDRYQHIIRTYGPITIEILKTSDPVKTENYFLYQYRKEFLELPPLNLNSYKKSLLPL